MKNILLAKTDPRAPKKLDKEKTKKQTEKLLLDLDELQRLLYAAASHSMIVVIQGMDASGKDGLVENVLGKLNPQGVSVKCYKAPTHEELAHDFLWRIHKETPEKGMIKVFNRSHYEDILVTRVHGWCDDTLAKNRIKAINDFEQLLAQHSNTIIIKLYLHISQKEQHLRLKERMEDPTKMWKYNEKDWEESKLWNKYMRVYEQCFAQTNRIPWHIIPAEQNWYKEYLVADLLVKELKKLNLRYPLIKKSV
jgi:PPK2 family polyphosphate:nucleotide phosphotransferase